MAELFVGLMSGTSMDGIDAVLVSFEHRQPRLASARAFPWPGDVLASLRELAVAETASIDDLGMLDARVGELLADAVNSLLAEAGVAHRQVKAIGSHGQTLRHRPQGRLAFSLQIGDPARIAERTGITTVADFRRRDIAAGGEGAPLVPAFHAALFRRPGEARAVLNVGGIANLTLLPGDPGAQISGFDTGPGNRLLDDWIRRHHGQDYDARGAWAATGQVEATLLEALLADPFFVRPPPKSTGSEHFNLAWAERSLPQLATLNREDVQATFAELTARSIGAALRRHAPETERLLVCGGGAHNDDLMERIATAARGMQVETTDAHGVNADWIEAMAFAWLARETLAGRPGNLPAVTGAKGPRVLGGIYPG